MKFKTVLLMGALLALLSMVACTMRSHTEPEIVVDNSLSLGQAIVVNPTTERPQGITEIHINQGDTIAVHLSSALLRLPIYEWTSETEGVVKFVKSEDDPTMFYAIALGDSGATSKVDLNDAGNGALKHLDVYIENKWADPFYFTYVGDFQGHSYYISTITRTWVEAELLCREAGGYMAAIGTVDENVFLDDVRGTEANVWIGIRLNNVNGSFKVTTWANGEAVDYRAFNSTDAGIFAEFYYFMDSNGKWENWHEISYPFFLEME